MAKLFNKQAKQYWEARPCYPQQLFHFIASATPSHDCVWDVGTGSGQAAAPVTPLPLIFFISLSNFWIFVWCWRLFLLIVTNKWWNDSNLSNQNKWILKWLENDNLQVFWNTWVGLNCDNRSLFSMHHLIFYCKLLLLVLCDCIDVLIGVAHQFSASWDIQKCHRHRHKPKTARLCAKASKCPI